MPAIRRESLGISRGTLPYTKHEDHRLRAGIAMREEPQLGARTSLQIPRCVKDICALVCLLWFNPYSEVAYLVVDLVKAHCNGQPVSATEHVTRLSELTVPRKEFLHFAARLIRLTGLSSETLSIAGLYMWRFRRRAASPVVGKAHSEYRLFVVALMLANKFMDDVSFSTSTWSRFTGLPKSDLPIMEREFLRGINFSLHVTETQWEAWRSYEHIIAVATGDFQKLQSAENAPVYFIDSCCPQNNVVPA